MSDERTLEVRVVSPSRVGYEGDAVSVRAPAHDGMLGILYGHAPMTVLLGEGRLTLREAGGAIRHFHVARGFLQVVDDRVSVLAEEVEVLDDAGASEGAAASTGSSAGSGGGEGSEADTGADGSPTG